MNELEPNLHEVKLYVSDHDFQDLVQVIGNFAFGHSLKLEIDSNPDDIVATSLDGAVEQYTHRENGETLIFDPDLVTWVIHPETKHSVAIVTKENFQQYAVKRFGEKPRGTMASSIIRMMGSSTTVYNPHLLEDCFLFQPQANDQDDLIPGQKRRKNALGIKVNKMIDLYRELKVGTATIRNVGKSRIQFLGDYCRELFADDQVMLSVLENSTNS